MLTIGEGGGKINIFSFCSWIQHICSIEQPSFDYHTRCICHNFSYSLSIYWMWCQNVDEYLWRSQQLQRPMDMIVKEVNRPKKLLTFNGMWLSQSHKDKLSKPLKIFQIRYKVYLERPQTCLLIVAVDNIR